MTTAAPTRRPKADTEGIGRPSSRELSVPSGVRCEDLLPVTTVSTVAADDGVALRVEEIGDASAPMTVVFVHGFCLHMGSWYFQRRDLPDCTDARLVFYDQRSHGRSGRSSTGHCTIDQLGRDLAAVLRTVAPTGPVVLVGHSMGGMTIMALARQDPELFATRVAGVALISTAAAGLVPAVLRLGAHHPGCSVLRRLGATTPWLLEHASSPAVAVLAPLIRALSYGEHPTTGAVTGFFQQMIAATPPRTVLNFLPTLSTHDELAALSALRQCPVVVCCGAVDRLTPPRHTTVIGKALPAARLLIAPRAGHLLPLEQPELVTAALADLIEEAGTRLVRSRPLRSVPAFPITTPSRRTHDFAEPPAASPAYRLGTPDRHRHAAGRRRRRLDARDDRGTHRNREECRDHRGHPRLG